MGLIANRAGSIPGLGWAFKKRDKGYREVELMVFLLPRITRELPTVLPFISADATGSVTVTPLNDNPTAAAESASRAGRGASGRSPRSGSPRSGK